MLMVFHKLLFYGKNYPKCYFIDHPHHHQIKFHNNSIAPHGLLEKYGMHWAGLSSEHEGQTPTQGWKPPRKPQHCNKLFIPRETARCTRESAFGSCSLGGNVCYGKDAENNHMRVLRDHMHTVENKQNYSFPKYLRVESLQKASKLYCRSKIGRRG